MKPFHLALLFLFISFIAQIDATCVGGSPNGILEAGESCDINLNACCTSFCTCNIVGNGVTAGLLTVVYQDPSVSKDANMNTNVTGTVLQWGSQGRLNFIGTTGCRNNYTMSEIGCFPYWNSPGPYTTPFKMTSTNPVHEFSNCSLQWDVVDACTNGCTSGPGGCDATPLGPITSVFSWGWCGDNVTDSVSGETCDNALINGGTGQCCTSSCALVPWTAGTPSTIYVQNCNATNVSVSAWYPTTTVAQSTWVSLTVVSNTCTGATLNGGVNGYVNFPARTSPGQSCSIRLRASDGCGRTLDADIGTVNRQCCGDGILWSSSEQCDFGNVTNNAVGSCCSSVCQNVAFTPTTYTSVNINNCNANTYPLSLLTPIKSISDTYISTLTYLASTCTGTSLVGGKTGNISFPALGTPGSCNGLLTYNTTCGLKTNVTTPFIRYCCGDGVFTSGPEGCDLGVNNGAAGSCCTTSCQDAAISFNGAATIYVPACSGTIFYVPVANFYPGINVSSTYWSSVVVSLESCTGSVSANLTHVRFNYGSVPTAGDTCGVTLTLTTTCGSTFGSLTTGIIFYCCGDGTITTPIEFCDRGASNGVDCCSSNCSQVLWTNSANASFTIAYTAGTTNKLISSSYMATSNFPSTLWRTTGATISGTCTNDALSSTNPRTGNVVFTGSPAVTTTCTSIVNPLLITACGAVPSIPFAATVLETGKCGNSVLDAGEACDLGTNNGVAGSCCTTTCTFAPWTIGTPIISQIDNCNSGDGQISDWYQSSTVSTTFWSSVSVSSENCTGNINTQGGVTGTVHFPVAGAGGELCVVTLLATSTCGNTKNSTDTAIRYCCGDGVVTPGSPEMCDQGANNGVSGFCCSATCTTGAFTATAPSPVVINNCAAVNQSVSTWFVSPSITSGSWTSASITAQNCTPSATLIGGASGVISIPAESAPQTCFVTVQVGTACGQTNTQTKSITRACCGDSIVSGTETCDAGVNNGAPGGCCSSSCVVTAFSASAPSPATVANCADVNQTIASWFLSSTVNQSTWSSVTISAQNCTPAVSLVSGVTGNVLIPAESSPQVCYVTLLATTPCGQTVSNTKILTRTCCGDGVVYGSEQCDIGANNGLVGYCCTSGCAIISFTATAPSPAEIQNCNAFNVSFANWYVSPTVVPASWSSTTITAQNCTPAASVVGTQIQFPAQSSPQVCYVTTNVVTSCGQSLSATNTITRSCCSDGISSGSETCDLGSPANGALGSCCPSNCLIASAPFTASNPSTYSPLTNCASATIPYTTWFPSPSINASQWSTVVVASTTCTGSVSVSGLNVFFPAFSAGETCTVTLTATASCGQTLSKTMTVVRTCCGNSVVEAGESCDGGACCQNTCAFYTSSQQCRSTTGVCDLPEFCTGSSAICPANVLQPNTYQCATSTNDCTVNVTCDGVSNTCPSNNVVSGTTCHFNANYCFSDTCNGNGTCVRGAAINYDNGVYCDGAETCNTTTGTLIQGAPPTCNDSNSCTTDSCSFILNACVNTPTLGTYGQCGSSNVGACQYGTYSCVGTGPTPNITCVGSVEPTTEQCAPPADTNCNGVVGDGCPLYCTVDANCSSAPRTVCQDAHCNPANNSCYLVPKLAGTNCTDGLACTINDYCFNGACVGDLISCNDDNQCTVDTCTEPAGVCVYDLAANLNLPCNVTNDYCRTMGLCNNQGECVDGMTTSCPFIDQCHSNQCDPDTGTCVSVEISGACNDGLACTINDACGCGVCSGRVIDCNDNIPCTTDSCSEPGGLCVHALDAGTCLIDGQCYLDNVQNPSNPCLHCNSALSVIHWSFTPLTNHPCNDNDACTENDVCVPAFQTCQGTPITCSASTNQCETVQCSGGQCLPSSVTDNTPCDDGHYCTTGEVCLSGACQAAQYRDCSGLDTQCTIHQCDELTSSCVAINVPSGTECVASASVCAGVGMCDGSGNCGLGASLVCPNLDPCSLHSCNATYGCVFQSLTGSSCDDNNVCTLGDTCSVHEYCTPGSTYLNCDDSDKTTADYCDATLGCQHQTLASTDFCVFHDDCSPSVCHSVLCLSNVCTYTSLGDGSLCNDGDVCNGQEFCHGGVCIDGIALSCDDDNPCTTDLCDPLTGCYHTPISGPYTSTNPCINTASCVAGTLIEIPFVLPSTTACLTYTCHPDPSNPTSAHVFVGTPINEGGVCDDSNACTFNDVCRHGQCLGYERLCPASDNQCIVDYTCDTFTGDCTPNYVVAGTPCETGDLCYDDECDGAGGCNPVALAVTCVPVDQCHGPGSCIPQTGDCTTPLLNDGTSCDDGNACTQVDTCVSGYCLGANPVICVPLDECHHTGECDTSTGLCSNPIVPDGSFCEDSNLCTTAETCQGGICTPCGYTDCTPSNPCLLGSCDPILGCQTTFNDGIPCDDGSLCTNNTVCASGVCSPTSGQYVACPQTNLCAATMCSPETGCMQSEVDNCVFCLIDADCPYFPCHAQHCNTTSQTCYYTHDNTKIIGCLDSLYCNGIETCNAGTCIEGVPPSCDDGNACTVGFCNYTLNACVQIPRTGVACDSVDACVIEAACDSNGNCVPSQSVNCAPSPPCWEAEGCNSVSGECEYISLANGISCDDGNLCSTGDVCHNGACTYGALTTCPPTGECQVSGACNPQTGLCVVVNEEDGTPCDDGLFCTINDRCSGGACTVSDPNICAGIEYDQCQYIICDEGTDNCLVGNVNDGTSCYTGTPYGPCSVAQDVCVGGTCTRQYQDGLLCRPADNSGCDLADHCVVGNDFCPNDDKKADGTTCPSTNPCIDNTCFGGVCLFDHNVDCSYLTNITHYGVCDPLLGGCSVLPFPDGTPCVSGTTLGQCAAFEAVINGQCVMFFKPSSTSCDDGSLCTTGDHCTGNADLCVGGASVDCSSFNTDCSQGLCNATDGSCYLAPLHDGIMCNADNDPCTVNDTCVSGTCVAGLPKDCSMYVTPCQNATCVNETCITFITDVNCSDTYCEGGCTYTRNYWAYYNMYCFACNLVREFHPWPNITGHHTETNLLCGKTWYQWIIQQDKGYAFRKLAGQWITAYLNQLNGACFPYPVQVAFDEATTLLADCRTTLSVWDVAADPYKALYEVLYAYNTGTTGPGICNSAFCDNSNSTTTAFNTTACLTRPSVFYRRVNPTRDVVFTHVEFIANDDPENCHHGVYNHVLMQCDCHLGWTGSECDKCAEPYTVDHVYLCVPSTIEEHAYVLRSVPSRDVALYLTPHALSYATKPSYYPNTHGLECDCSTSSTALTFSAHGTKKMARSAQVQAWDGFDDTSLVTHIERLTGELESCEATWSVDNVFENASTVVYINVTESLPPQSNPWIISFYTLVASFLIFLVIFLFFCPRTARRKASKRL